MSKIVNVVWILSIQVFLLNEVCAKPMCDMSIMPFICASEGVCIVWYIGRCLNYVRCRYGDTKIIDLCYFLTNGFAYQKTKTFQFFVKSKYNLASVEMILKVHAEWDPYSLMNVRDSLMNQKRVKFVLHLFQYECLKFGY